MIPAVYGRGFTVEGVGRCLAVWLLCGGWWWSSAPPQIQGDRLTSEQRAQVREGMTKKQVGYLLGMPLLQTPFHPRRWCYVLLQGRAETRILRRFIVEFDASDRVVKITDFWDTAELPQAASTEVSEVTAEQAATEPSENT